MGEPIGRVNWAERAREWFAVMATAALSAMASGLALVLWLGPWGGASEGQRVGFLGTALLILVSLVGLGASWLWKMQHRSLEVKAGLVQISLSGEAPDKDAARSLQDQAPRDPR